jgi:acyl carrier protein
LNQPPGRLKFGEFARHVTAEFGDRGVPLVETTELYDELGLDSLEAFRLVILIEDLAGVDFPPATTPMLWTLRDAYTYLQQLTASVATQNSP